MEFINRKATKVDKTDIKYLFRSNSFQFMSNRNNKNHAEFTYSYKGNEIHYRAGTSDMVLIYEILLKNGYHSEYWLPESFNPRLILDIGANIGMTSILFANQYPNSTIHAFEPLPDNYNLLNKNTAPYHIRCHPFGLGKTDDSVSLYTSNDPDNFGGGSIYDTLGVDNNQSVSIDIKNTKTYLSSFLESPPDLIKIDTEGSEFDILNSFDQEMLSQVKWITGGLHGHNDFLLLHQLSELGFNIKTRKEVDNRLSMFHAISEDTLQQLTSDEIKKLNKK